MEGAIRRIANFLSIPAPPDKVKELKDHLDIKNFSSNPAVNFEPFRDVGVLSKQEERSFVRKGFQTVIIIVPTIIEQLNLLSKIKYNKVKFHILI